MEKRRVPDNVTLAGLRRLLEAIKERAGAKAAVCVTLELWYYDDTIANKDKIEERIGVYNSREGPTKHCTSLKEAHDYIKTLEKGGD